MLHLFRSRSHHGCVVVSRIAAALFLAACSSASDNVTAPSAGAPTRLELSTNGVALAGLGAADSIIATLRDADGNNVSASAVRWTSDNPLVAQVSASGSVGTVTGRAAGVTRIHATAGSLAMDVDVQVLGVRGVSLVQSAVALRAGDTQLLGTLIDADVNTSMTLHFTSLNAAVATVSADGVVSGLSAGTTTVRVSSAADPRVFAMANITVNPARAVSFAPGGSAITLWVGDARSLSANVDVDANESHDIVWSSENIAVATISESGVITATGIGTAIIRASSAADPRARAELLLTVRSARTVSVSPDTASLVAGAQQQFAATVVIEDGLSTKVVWSSSDTSVATVSDAGMVSAVAAGSTTITATSMADATRTGTATVIVNNTGASGGAVSAQLRRSK